VTTSADNEENAKTPARCVVDGFTLEESAEIANKALDKMAIALGKTLARRHHEADLARLKHGADEHDAPQGV
jgi:hypothetical protein